MGEVKAISEGCLEPANHRDSALANHGESVETRPGASLAGALRISCRRRGLLQSQLRIQAPPTPLLSRGTLGERAGWLCSSPRLL